MSTSVYYALCCSLYQLLFPVPSLFVVWPSFPSPRLSFPLLSSPFSPRLHLPLLSVSPFSLALSISLPLHSPLPPPFPCLFFLFPPFFPRFLSSPPLPCHNQFLISHFVKRPLPPPSPFLFFLFPLFSPTPRTSTGTRRRAGWRWRFSLPPSLPLPLSVSLPLSSPAASPALTTHLYECSASVRLSP